MRHLTTSLLAASLLLAACTAPPAPGRPPTSPGPARGTAKPSSAPSKAPAAIQLLKAPPGATTRLAGKITLDAGYLLAQGAASLASDNGAAVIARDGAAVIARDGASAIAPASGNAVIARDGASLIGDDGGAPASGPGNRVALDGSGVIARDGASVIARDGASVIARDGAGVVARDGAAVIARDGAAYRLAQAATLAAGTERPVAAMQLRVFSLTTNRPLTLGVDADGKPVDAIYTNGEGRFEVFLPADVGDRAVRVVAAARLPGAEALRYDLIAAPAREAELDEDTQLITAYMMEIYMGRLRYLMEKGPDKLDRAFGVRPGVDVPAAQQRIREFQARLADVAPAERERRYAAAARLLLAAPQTSIFDVRPLDEEDFYGPERLARLRALYPDATGFEILRDVLRRVRRAVAARLAKVAEDRPGADPIAYLDELPVVAEYRRLRGASARLGGTPAFHLTNATDFNLFMTRAYLGNELTGCADGGTACDAFSFDGDTLPEIGKYDGVARLLEGTPPARPTSYYAPNLRGLFVEAPAPDVPPRLSALYTGADALPADVALPQDVTWGLAYGARGISMRLLLTLLFTPEDAMDPGTLALLGEFEALFEGR